MFVISTNPLHSTKEKIIIRFTLNKTYISWLTNFQIQRKIRRVFFLEACPILVVVERYELARIHYIEFWPCVLYFKNYTFYSMKTNVFNILLHSHQTSSLLSFAISTCASASTRKFSYSII